MSIQGKPGACRRESQGDSSNSEHNSKNGAQPQQSLPNLLKSGSGRENGNQDAARRLDSKTLTRANSSKRSRKHDDGEGEGAGQRQEEILVQYKNGSTISNDNAGDGSTALGTLQQNNALPASMPSMQHTL